MKKISSFLILIFTFLIVVSYYSAHASTSLVFDINSNGDSIHHYDNFFLVFNSKLYITANDGIHGYELWAYDGLHPPFMVVDINNGSGSSSPSALAIFNSKLYFSADNGSDGKELWTYDGTSEPTMVADINSGPDSSSPSELIVFDSKLFFAADNGSDGKELWEYDGINEPVMVADINSGPDSSSPSDLIVFDSKLFFSADNGSDGKELWTYDGTSEPTMVADINSGPGNSSPSDLIVFDSKLYFAIDNDTDHEQLWVYDGVNVPTMVDYISYGGQMFSYYSDFTVFNFRLYFKEHTTYGAASHNANLFTYDGTSVPTYVCPMTVCTYLGPLWGTYCFSAGSNLTIFNSKLYFANVNNIYGSELWGYDGITIPFLVADIRAGEKSSSPLDLIVFNNNLYFSADDGIHGRELWVYEPLGKPSSTSNSVAPVLDLLLLKNNKE